MRKTKKASTASTKTKRAADTSRKVRSFSDLRVLQRQADNEPAPRPASQARRRPHRFLPPRPGPLPTAQRGPEGAAHPDSPSARTSTRQGPGPITGSRPAPVTPQKHGTAADSSDSVLDPEDIALFRRVVESVTPSPKSDRLILDPVPSGTPAQLRQRRQQAMGGASTPALDVSDQYAPGHLEHDDTVFLQSGQGPHLIKGLRKGKWPVQASLDLHGSTLDDARERMDRFIQSCREHEIRCVRIVHGKGYGSKDGNPILKETVRRWLSQLAVVQAYVESDEANGGAGAVLVLLSKANQ